MAKVYVEAWVELKVAIPDRGDIEKIEEMVRKGIRKALSQWKDVEILKIGAEADITEYDEEDLVR